MLHRSYSNWVCVEPAWLCIILAVQVVSPHVRLEVVAPCEPFVALVAHVYSLFWCGDISLLPDLGAIKELVYWVNLRSLLITYRRI